MTSLYEPAAGRPLVRVVVERGVDAYPDGLTYSVPPELAGLAPGERVRVPLGRGDTPTAGYVVEALDGAGQEATDPLRIKSVLERDAGGIALPPALMQLARWISSYYVAPIGVTLGSIVPAAVKRQVGAVTRRMVDLAPETPTVDGAAAAPPGRRLTPKQQAVLAHLRGLAPERRPVEIGVLAEATGLATPGPVTTLVARGLLTIERRTTVEAAWQQEAIERTPPPTLTDEQRAAVESIAPDLGSREESTTPRFAVHLLFGVTGSGKTEVYLRLIEEVVAAGRTALLLVPEIALTPQSGGRVIGRFAGRRVAILHSGLTAAQRHLNWSLVADGKADIVLGARSAVFAPIPAGALGLIVVDEEHDSSYKQESAPRYHGRDVAVRRAQLEGCPIVLGSATPSLESWHNATARGTYALHRLTRRAPGLRVPAVRVVDFVEERRARAGDRRVHLLGPTLEGALRRTLSEEGQALLLLNRRGFGNYIACPDRTCGWLLECDHCDATMVCHLDPRTAAGRYVRCHHCEAERQLPARCPRCENRLTVFGFGTQRVEEELVAKFPELVPGSTLERVDSDSMGGAADLHSVLRRFGSGELRVLLGTQMIAKGLDFPGVTLVGVVNADTALALPDFRSAERTFQLVAQVAGRCGRGSAPGLALVQSFQPGLPALQLAARCDYEAFAGAELEERAAMRLPPFSRMARVVVRHRDREACAALAQGTAHGLRLVAAQVLGDPAPGEDDALERPRTVRVRGPAPCPIARVAERYRHQVELFAATAGPLQKLLAAARSAGVLRPGETMAVDVDPVAAG